MVCRALGSLLLSPMPCLHADSIRKPRVSVFYLVTQHVSSSLSLIWKTCPDSSDLSRSPLCPPKFQASNVVALMVTLCNRSLVYFFLTGQWAPWQRGLSLFHVLFSACDNAWLWQSFRQLLWRRPWVTFGDTRMYMTRFCSQGTHSLVREIDTQTANCNTAWPAGLRALAEKWEVGYVRMKK